MKTANVLYAKYKGFDLKSVIEQVVIYQIVNSVVKMSQQLTKVRNMVKRFRRELQDVKPTPECE